MQEGLLHLADTPWVLAVGTCGNKHKLEWQPIGEEQTRRSIRVQTPNQTTAKSTKSRSPTQTQPAPQ